MNRSTSKDEIRKGPWKAEEDEILLNHVRRYGPRDWSSIRSKGLLQRTGKSCRLRWVNKLRPNLKNGCKFTPEEERIVIELQAQFGNKWARIATYLPGRTDNDVKNFWSSRQKRLARILQTSAASSSSSSSKSLRTKRNVPVRRNTVPSMEIATLPFFGEEPEQPCPKPQRRSAEDSETLKAASLPELEIPNSLNDNPICANSQELFPPILQAPEAGMTFLPGGNDFLGRLEDSNLFDAFEPIGAVSGIGEADQFPGELPFFELSGGFRTSNLDNFFDDFPTDMLDDVGSPASPPRP
ncbi:transcription factor DUO1 [Punica granatum]|uniref:Transcription factor DUO1 n=1 Tax=Punica granatum TaxID=22663 RepID=A0A6P8DM61_PUNGR|nr:transcription factor DUO1 [Punica granatum]